jgi:hypothetical protein
VKKELAIFEVEGKCGANLKICYKNLNSIPPSIFICLFIGYLTSMEPDTRTFFFQDVEELLQKLVIRSSLHDVSVDMLTFLRGYFKTENN